MCWATFLSHPGKPEPKNDPLCSVFIKPIPVQMSADTLKQFFLSYGPIDYIIRYQNQSWAMLIFKNQDDAKKLIDSKMKDFAGSPCTICYAKQRDKEKKKLSSPERTVLVMPCPDTSFV